MCSVCGAILEAHDTSRGVRYRCPECGKFVRPVIPEDVKEVEATAEQPAEPARTDAKARAKAMLLAGKWSVEDIVAQTALDRMVIIGIKGGLARHGRLPSQVETQVEKEKRGRGEAMRTPMRGQFTLLR